MELEELLRLRDELLAARYAGVLSVRAGEQTVTYRSEAELRAALAELEAHIAKAQGKGRVQRARAWCAKGL
ncbi:MAG: hypothetical protein N2690_03575 [Rhodocyclaceae bacterium]|nr:hypothetical protein [Rhodocyclaceae bacterium]